MGDNDLLTVTIHLVHGESIKFEVSLSVAKEYSLGEDIEQSLLRNAMAIEMDNKLIMIPYGNIKYVECDPAPPVLPLNMIRGARHLLS